MPMIPCSFGVVTEPRYAAGGLAQAAQRVGEAGRNGDSVVVHLAPEEFDWLRANWGEPTVNPQTGLPEYFKLADAFRAVAPFIPLVANVAAPGLTTAIGSALGAQEWAPAIGSALLGAGTGALAGGAQGALGGALAGAGSAAIAPGLRDALAGGAVGNWLGIPAPAAAGAATGSSPSILLGGTDKRTVIEGTSGAPAQKASPGAGKQAQGSSLLPLLLGGGALLMGSQMMGRPKAAQASPPAMPQPNFKPAAYTMTSRAIPGDRVDWFKYGQRPQTDYSDPMFMERSLVRTAANGGPIHGSPLAMLAQGGAERAQGAVAGPGTGRSDEIPARLSDGEYVIDAETVALLGDGSSDAGAKRLDQFRENIRAHKGGALSAGKISPDAKNPEQYLGRRQ